MSHSETRMKGYLMHFGATKVPSYLTKAILYSPIQGVKVILPIELKVLSFRVPKNSQISKAK